MLKIAIIGISHFHAKDVYRAYRQYKDEVEVIGYADVPPYDEQDWDVKADECFAEGKVEVKRYEDYFELLDKKPDIVVITSTNSQKFKIAMEAMERKIHVLIEKPLCTTYEEAKMMYECSLKNNVLLTVNWPVAWFPSFNKCKELVDSGKVGKIFRVVYRSPATWGPYSYGSVEDGNLEALSKTWWYKKEFGGGALFDYACYGAALTTWFFNKEAEKVSGIAKNFTLPNMDVEDYSAMIADFGDGVGLFEGNWVTYNAGEVPSGPVIYGEKGIIVCDRHSTKVKVYLNKTHDTVKPDEEYECKNVYIGDACKNVLNHLIKGTPLHKMLETKFNVWVMAILDAGIKSIEQDINVKIDKIQ